ncbi:hypothetical protein [Methyloglobulus sp.]|uniref:hypothetical protein n=1 Tax=Methyloglobulus sp. TaxID=2518622 RepID=UPI0032B7C68B
MDTTSGNPEDPRFEPWSAAMSVVELRKSHQKLSADFWEYMNAVMTTSYVGSIPTLPKGKKLSGIAMFIATFVVHF